MEKLLNELTSLVQEYKDLGDQLVFEDASRLSVILKNLTSTLFYLESYRDEASRKYNTIMHTSIKAGSSVSGSEIIAKEQCPELYMLRRIMQSGYNIVDAIRSNISFLKSEK